MVTIVNALTFITGGVIGYLIGTMIEHRLARSRSIEVIRITEFNKAAAAFYAAFLDEIMFLEDTDSKEVPIEKLKKREIERRIAEENGLKSETVSMRYRKAMIIFRPYIDKRDLPGFDAAWSAYND